MALARALATAPHRRRADAAISPVVLVKGAGEMASGIAWRFHMAGLRRICMLDLAQPLCVRRTVSFCTALEAGAAEVEGVRAVRARTRGEIEAAWAAGAIAVVCTDDWARLGGPAPEVVIDAILAKRNTGTAKRDAPLVIALGPGFEAGTDCHLVIETNRGHDLGRLIERGGAAPNTGVPGAIAGYAAERVLRAPAEGTFLSEHRIGDAVRKGDAVGTVAGDPVVAGIDGVLRGLIRAGTAVARGLKVGDVDPRGRQDYCHTISEKARAIAGAALEGVLRHCNAAGAGI
jgi:xanthine dehydrogenase accessory factor